MDVKKLVIENAVLRYERDNSIRVDSKIKEALSEAFSIAEVEGGDAIPVIKLELSLEEAIKYFVQRDQLVAPVTRGIIDKDKDHEAHTAEMDAGIKEAAASLVEPVVEAPDDSPIPNRYTAPESVKEVVAVPNHQRLHVLSEKLLGEDDLGFTEDDKKIVRVMYHKIVGSKSHDEVDDFKTIIETFKGTPDELDEDYPKLKPVIEKVLKRYE
jgi:hypothetical protein